MSSYIFTPRLAIWAATASISSSSMSFSTSHFSALQKDVVLTGMDTRIELWSAEKWDVENDMDDEDMEAVAAHMASLGVNI